MSQTIHIHVQSQYLIHEILVGKFEWLWTEGWYSEDSTSLSTPVLQKGFCGLYETHFNPNFPEGILSKGVPTFF